MHFISLPLLAVTVIASPVAQENGAKGGESKGKTSSSSLGKPKVHLIFARGTSVLGSMGAVVGPGLSSALSPKFGAANFRSEGVAYAAGIAEAFSGGLNPKDAARAKKKWHR
jgi:hypothetical protein